MSDRERSDPAVPDASPEDAPFLERHVVPLLAESTLWPVWLVVMGSVAAIAAWALQLAWAERRLSAFAGAFGLAWLTATLAWSEIRQRRRPGAVTLAVLLTWAIAAGFLAGAHHLGAF